VHGRHRCGLGWKRTNSQDQIASLVLAGACADRLLFGIWGAPLCYCCMCQQHLQWPKKTTRAVRTRQSRQWLTGMVVLDRQTRPMKRIACPLRPDSVTRGLRSSGFVPPTINAHFLPARSPANHPVSAGDLLHEITCSWMQAEKAHCSVFTPDRSEGVLGTHVACVLPCRHVILHHLLVLLAQQA
jgi:hypothetical protein